MNIYLILLKYSNSICETITMKYIYIIPILILFVISCSVKDGPIIEYYEDGQIKEEKHYKDGKKDGKWIWYYENGLQEKEGNFKDGKEDGKWTWYYENGEIKKEENYKDGELIE